MNQVVFFILSFSFSFFSDSLDDEDEDEDVILEELDELDSDLLEDSIL